MEEDHDVVDYDELQIGDYLEDDDFSIGEIIKKEHYGLWIKIHNGAKVFVPRKKYGWNCSGASY